MVLPHYVLVNAFPHSVAMNMFDSTCLSIWEKHCWTNTNICLEQLLQNSILCGQSRGVTFFLPFFLRTPTQCFDAHMEFSEGQLTFQLIFSWCSPLTPVTYLGHSYGVPGFSLQPGLAQVVVLWRSKLAAGTLYLILYLIVSLCLSKCKQVGI